MKTLKLTNISTSENATFGVCVNDGTSARSSTITSHSQCTGSEVTANHTRSSVSLCTQTHHEQCYREILCVPPPHPHPNASIHSVEKEPPWKLTQCSHLNNKRHCTQHCRKAAAYSNLLCCVNLLVKASADSPPLHTDVRSGTHLASCCFGLGKVVDVLAPCLYQDTGVCHCPVQTCRPHQF